MAYDYGVMRENYLFHYLNDWCRRRWDSVLHRPRRDSQVQLYGRYAAHHGRGAPASASDDGQNLVDVAVKFVNQRGEDTVRATATISLPSRTNPLPLYPEVPYELAQKAAQMMARHWELSKR